MKRSGPPKATGTERLPVGAEYIVDDGVARLLSDLKGHWHNGLFFVHEAGAVIGFEVWVNTRAVTTGKAAL